MKVGALLLLLFLVLMHLAQAVERRPEKLRFNNRARCALESKKPSRSLFVFMDNVDLAKSIYRLAQDREEGALEVTKRGISRFRYSTMNLLQMIMQKVMDGELPILSTDRESKRFLKNYAELIDHCQGKKPCLEMDEYLQDIWDNSQQRSFLKKIDKFKKRHFAKTGLFTGMACSRVVKMSYLHAPLFISKPGINDLQSMLSDYQHWQDFLAPCDAVEVDEKNFKVALYQLDFGTSSSKKWNQLGFDFWNSVRLYFSHAFRHSDIFAQMSYPFNQIFKSLELEKYVFLVPNGCRGLSPPECSEDYLNISSMRDFVDPDFERNAHERDIYQGIPQGPGEDLLETPLTAAEQINYLQDEDTEQHSWTQRFAQNMAETRSYYQKRLVKGLFMARMISENLSVERIFDAVAGIVYKEKYSPEELQGLYQLCSEFIYTTHEDFSLYKAQFDLLNDSSPLEGLASNISKDTIKNYYQYLLRLSEWLTPLCSDSQLVEIWRSDFEVDKEGFRSWYIDQFHEGKFQHREKPQREGENSLLVIERPGVKKTICHDGIECARDMLESVVHLYSASRYAERLWSLQEKVKAPSVFNSYGERVACKMYDPWFKTKSLLVNFFTDLTFAAASASVGLPLYADVSLRPGEVTSLEALAQDGRIVYKPHGGDHSLSYGFIANLGELAGIPCTVSLSNDSNQIYSAFRYLGMSIGACNMQDEYNLMVVSGSEIGDNDHLSSSQCFSCQLNFEGVVGMVSHYSIPVVGPIFYVFRAFYRFIKGWKDQLNIPRSYRVNFQQLVETNYYLGHLPKFCLKLLRKGKDCLEEPWKRALKNLYVRYGYPQKIEIDDWDKKNKWLSELALTLEMPRCRAPVQVRIHEDDQWGFQVDLDEVRKECE